MWARMRREWWNTFLNILEPHAGQVGGSHGREQDDCDRHNDRRRAEGPLVGGAGHVGLCDGGVECDIDVDINFKYCPGLEITTLQTYILRFYEPTHSMNNIDMTMGVVGLFKQT